MDHDKFAAVLLEAAPDGLLVVDRNGVIELANPAAARLFGYGEGELEGTNVDALVPAELRAAHADHREQYAEGPTRRPMGTGLRLFGQHQDGSLFPVEISISPLENDELRVIATVRDVTEREDAATRLAMMKDRERIARDLHDMVIQRIFAAGMHLQAVAGDADSAIVASRIRETVDELDEAIRELRAAIFRLSDDDDRRSVSTQLADLAHNRMRPLEITPDLQIHGDVESLADYVLEQLLATVNEGLSNVARHSGATEVRVDIRLEGGKLTVEMRDNGVGISERPRRRGGISNMMWRAAELGGTCTVGANEPVGVAVLWQVPA